MENRQTKILVEADIELYLKDVKEKQRIRVSNIPCVWNWDNGSRESAEYWAVHDWIDNTFGNNLETYWIICVIGSPVKEGEDAYPMILSEVSDESVVKAMEVEKEVIWGR